METAILGPEHAAEHALARRAERRSAPGAEPATDPRAALSSEAAPPLPDPGPPAEVGAWTERPFDLPTYAINATVVATGEVLFWGRPPQPEGNDPRPNVGEAALWSPRVGTGADAFQDVHPPVIDADGPGGQPPGPASIFCSGLSQLPDGQVVVAGGTLVYGETFLDDPYTTYAGLSTIFTFDPFGGTWTQQPGMAEGRWYPSQALLADGRTIVAGGFADDPPGGVPSNSLEVFNPAIEIGGQGSVEQKPSADHALGTYPRLFSLGDDLLLAGPRARQVALLDTTSFTWDESLPQMSRTRLKGSAIRRPGGPAGSDVFTEVGGYETRGEGFQAATEASETIDLGQADPAWVPDAPLNVPRANQNTVLLPDGSMVTIGGGSGFARDNGGGYVTYADGRARQVELYDPASNSWRLGPAQEEDRAYHSIAVLLPDGRVLSAGDDLHPEEPNGDASRSDTAEIYSPPYLFKGPRPVIERAPPAVRWGDAFGIASASPDLERAVLVAPSATTHGFDMHQRHVELSVLNELPGRGLNVVAPPSARAAPPGYYMLFLLDRSGVPSAATWVRIDPAAPDQPPLGPASTADFNGDGFSDRVVGSPHEDLGSAVDAGVVNVIYGSADGLSAAGSQVWSAQDLGAGAPATGDRFGAALASGDFDRDGFADLAVGAPPTDVGSAEDAGAVYIITGSPEGLSGSATQTWTQESADVQDMAEAGERLGTSLAAADLNGDAHDDLAIGVPSESIGDVAGAGAVNVLYGAVGGLGKAGNQLFSQAGATRDSPEPGDSFGAALGAADLNGDAHDDLAIGVPSESIGDVAGAGAVNVLYGAVGGLGKAGNQLFSEDPTGMQGVAKPDDRFGAVLGGGAPGR